MGQADRQNVERTHVNFEVQRVVANDRPSARGEFVSGDGHQKTNHVPIDSGLPLR